MSKLRAGVAAFAVASLVVSLGLPAAGAAKFPTGTFTPTSLTGAQCPSGYTCTGFRVTCSGVQQPAEGFLARRSPGGTPRGLVMFFSPSGGTQWTSLKASADALLDEFAGAGLELVQVRWSEAWFDSAPGEKTGAGRLGCRPATVIKWVEANLYDGSSQPPLRCGFCVTGESGGASQISYALAFYGLDAIVDVAVPVSGPPHAALLKGCAEGFREYAWPAHTARTMDNSYGYFGGGGPCEQNDAAWSDRWTEDGVDTGGTDYNHPGTRITMLLGTKDGTRAPQHALDYADKLKAAGSPNVSVSIVSGMQHSAWDDQVGVDAMRAAILTGGTIPGTTPALPGAGSGSGSGGSGRPGRGGSASPDPSPSASATLSPTPSPSDTGFALPPTEPLDQAFPWIIALGGGALAAGLTYWLLRRRAKGPPASGGPSGDAGAGPEAALP